jgi:hypothetical protein
MTEGFWCLHLMEAIHNKLINLRGSVGNVPQKLKEKKLL